MITSRKTYKIRIDYKGIKYMKKKKAILLTSIAMTIAFVSLSLVAVGQQKYLVNAEFDETVSHQIILRGEDTHIESEDDYTKFFALHKDNATRSGYPIDSKPGGCLAMADGNRGAGGSQICFAEANPAVGTFAVLYISIPLTNIKSFSSVVLRGNFYRGYWTDLETELSFGSEKFFGDEIFLRIESTYREITLNEIEINYTCAI